MSLFWIQITRDEGSKIIQLLKSEGKYEQFLKNVSFVCHKCGSFVTKTPALLTSLEDLLEVIDDSEADVADQTLYDALCNMRNGLLNPIMLTDEEWTRYFTHGLKEYLFVHADKGELITDTEGNPLAYVSDEVVIELDDQCECGKILNRLKEDN